MGGTPAPQPAEALVQLVLRAHRRDPLVQIEEDWRALGLIAARALFWCGGAIYACRCEENEMRFALQLLHAPLGNLAHQIAGAYATRLRKTRGIGGPVFRHYRAIPLRDDIFLDDLVLWLHRSGKPTTSPAGTASPRVAAPGTVSRVWTADSAYLMPNSLPWIDTHRVLSALSVGAPGPATYRRRKSEQISPQVIEYFMQRPYRVRRKYPLSDARQAARDARPNIEAIARLVADYCNVSYGDMLADTRKRAVSKARAMATVLATRNGATAAAAARLFNRSRSTLIEQVEHYRATQPEMFAQAESLLNAFCAKGRE